MTLDELAHDLAIVNRDISALTRSIDKMREVMQGQANSNMSVLAEAQRIARASEEIASRDLTLLLKMAQDVETMKQALGVKGALDDVKGALTKALGDVTEKFTKPKVEAEPETERIGFFRLFLHSDRFSKVIVLIMFCAFLAALGGHVARWVLPSPPRDAAPTEAK